MLNKIKKVFKSALQNIRQLSGEDAYERYLAHYQAFHADKNEVEPPLSRQAFFKQWQDSKWKGIKRCC